jgi:hypothetical protein
VFHNNGDVFFGGQAAHREIDFDLIQPARMHRCAYARQRRPLRAEAGGRFFATVRRAIVRDPKDAAGGPIGLGRHHLLDESVDSANGGLRFAPAKQLRAMHIPRGEVRQRALPKVLVFDAYRPSASPSGPSTPAPAFHDFDI